MKRLELESILILGFVIIEGTFGLLESTGLSGVVGLSGLVGLLGTSGSVGSSGLGPSGSSGLLESGVLLIQVTLARALPLLPASSTYSNVNSPFSVNT